MNGHKRTLYCSFNVMSYVSMIIFAKGTIIKFHKMHNIHIAVVEKDYHEDDSSLTAKVYIAGERDPCTFYPTELHLLSKEVRLEQVEGVSITNKVITLSEKKYEDIFSVACDVEVEIPQTADEDQVTEPIFVSEKRGVRRQTRLPSHLRDYDV